MKRYSNGYKATEFSKKQINVLWAKAKNGELKIEKWYISELYNLADYYGYDYNASVSQDEVFVLNILDAMFAGRMEEAQERINNHQDWVYNTLSDKAKRAISREVLVA